MQHTVVQLTICSIDNSANHQQFVQFLFSYLFSYLFNQILIYWNLFNHLFVQSYLLISFTFGQLVVVQLQLIDLLILN